MNREETRFAAKIMEAWADGKTVQARDKHNDHSWFDCPSTEGGSMSWAWSEMDYRVKQEPRVIHFVEFSNGILSHAPISSDEVEKYADPTAIRSTRLVKFVEVVE